MDKIGNIQKQGQNIKKVINGNLLSREQPYLNMLARDMVLCKDESKRYAICVSSKGITVQQNECREQFSKLMNCLGLKIKD